MPDFRDVIRAWIQEDAPLTVKMTLYPEHIQKLVDRLSATRDAGTGRDSGGLAKLLSDAEPTISRRGDDITLHCPDGTITDELFDALEAACYAPAGLSALADPRGGEKP